MITTTINVIIINGIVVFTTIIIEVEVFIVTGIVYKSIAISTSCFVATAIER